MSYSFIDMKNKVLILILVIITFLFVPLSEAQNKVFKTSISKESFIDEIKEKAFEDIIYNKNVSMFKPADPDYKENQKAIKNGLYFIKNRYITYYSNSFYTVNIFDNLTFNRYFIYTSNGNLVSICYQKFPKHIKDVNDYYRSIMDDSIYPLKVYKYSYPKGDLIDVSYDVTVKHQYVFKPNGEFIRYWLDNNAYDPEGNLILQRDIKPFIEE